MNYQIAEMAVNDNGSQEKLENLVFRFYSKVRISYFLSEYPYIY